MRTSDMAIRLGRAVRPVECRQHRGQHIAERALRAPEVVVLFAELPKAAAGQLADGVDSEAAG